MMTPEELEKLYQRPTSELFEKLRELVLADEPEQAVLLIDSISAREQRYTVPESVNPTQGTESFERLAAWAEDFGHPDFDQWFKDLPPSLVAQWKQCGDGKVVLPDADHIPEAMVDASRGLHLYYTEAGSGVTCEQMRKHLTRYAPWTVKHFPIWFRHDDSHLTKAGRAIVAYALTVAANFEPKAREEYFANAGQGPKIMRSPWHQDIQLTFESKVGSFMVLSNLTRATKVADSEYQLVLNRSDLPKAHRREFNTKAVTLNLRLINEGTEVEFGVHELGVRLEGPVYTMIPSMTTRF